MNDNNTYPIEEIYIRSLVEYIDLPIWRNNTLRPIDVILNPEWYPEEYKYIMDANINIPIDIIIKNNKYIIVDGLDRLVKNWVMVKHKVKVRKFPK